MTSADSVGRGGGGKGREEEEERGYRVGWGKAGVGERGTLGEGDVITYVFVRLQVHNICIISHNFGGYKYTLNRIIMTLYIMILQDYSYITVSMYSPVV